MARKGFTLIEALAVVACLGLLAGIVVPSLSAARDAAKRLACAAQLHQVGVALSNYTTVHRFHMPPFRFSATTGNLPASGHWGGPSQFDPTLLINPQPINLWCLVAEDMLPPAALLCPAATADLRGGRQSLFPYTNRFSTYCLRFPPSSALFQESPALANVGGLGLLGVYLRYPGGALAPIGSGSSGPSRQTVPLVRLNRRYPLDPDVCFSSTTFDPAADAVVSDGFWWQSRCEPAPAAPPGRCSYAVNAAWSHAQQFNVLFGGGDARTLGDDGTVAANSVPPDGSRVDSGVHFGKYAERVWQTFDAAR